MIVSGVGSDTWDFEPTRGPVRLMACLAACRSLAERAPYGRVLGELMQVRASVLLDALTVE